MAGGGAANFCPLWRSNYPGHCESAGIIVTTIMRRGVGVRKTLRAVNVLLLNPFGVLQ